MIADRMSCNRFETIFNLRFCGNLESGNEPDSDCLYEVRLILVHVKSNCNVLPKCEKYTINKHIIPIKGNSSLKMYNPKKLKKMGL
jgi:hypothetical protein